MIGKPTIRYSEAFKKQVISELESGQLRHQAEARERYGIGGGDTINSWLRQKWKTSSQLRNAVGQAIWLYNGRRPHMSLGYRTPDQVHSDADPSCADNPPLSRAAQVRTGPRTGSGCRQNQNPAPECKNGTF